MATSKQTSIQITASTKLPEKDKERMIKEAEQFAEADKKKKEEAETRNQADSLLYTVEKTKSDLKDKIPTELLTKLDNASKDLKEVIAGQDVEAIKSKIENVTNVLKEIGTVAYQTAQAASGSGSNSSSSQSSSSNSHGSGKVIDADYKMSSEGSGTASKD